MGRWDFSHTLTSHTISIYFSFFFFISYSFVSQFQQRHNLREMKTIKIKMNCIHTNIYTYIHLHHFVYLKRILFLFRYGTFLSTFDFSNISCPFFFSSLEWLFLSFFAFFNPRKNCSAVGVPLDSRFSRKLVVPVNTNVKNRLNSAIGI